MNNFIIKNLILKYFIIYIPEPSDLNNKNPKIARPISQIIIRHEKIIEVTHLSNKYLFSKVPTESI